MLSYFSVRLLLVLALIPLADPTGVTGIVLDASGRPLPRVRVQVVSGAADVTTFTDVDGTFRVAAAPAADCRVRASLSGFQPSETSCDGVPLRLTLGVAPIEERVVVTATRTDAPAGQIASGLSVIDAVQIDAQQGPLVADLLRQTPGVTVVRSGSPGAVTSLFMRGGESNYTKVLLDGVPLNEPGGTFDFSNLSSENLDRIEIVRGANSALFGSDAMTGVIQLFTRRGTSSRPDILFAGDGGSFATRRGSASISGKAGRADYSALLSRFTTDNEVPNSAFRNTTASGTAGVDLGHGARLRLVGRVERGRSGTPGQAAFGRPDLDAFFVRHDATWGVTFDQAVGALRQRASYGLATTYQASTNLAIDPPYTPRYGDRVAPFEFFDFPFDSRADLRRHHASYQADWTSSTVRAGTHVDTALVDWDGERARLTDALAGSVTPASRDNVGVTLQHQALWPRVFATGSMRFEHNASFGNAVVPRASAVWYARTGGSRAGATKISASAGLGIKEPTILQSFSPSPFFLGNPDLEPERARTLDVGVEQRLLGDRVKLDATWFVNRYRNIISTQTTSYDPYRSQYFNIGLTRARGAELSGDVALVRGLRARAGYTFTDSKILESTSAFSAVFTAGNSAFRRPRHAGFADVSWTGGRISASLSGTFVGRRADSDFSSLEPEMVTNDGYGLWNARASGRVTRRLSATFAIDNLTGRRYMEPLGYPALGRAARAGLRARF